MSNDIAEFDFAPEFQDKVAHLLMRDGTFAMRVKDLIKPEYFSNSATGTVVKIVLEHIHKYKAVPDVRIISTLLRDEIAKKHIRPDMISDVVRFVQGSYRADISNPAFVTDKVSDFAKHQAMENAMMQAIPLIEKKDWGAISKIMKEAGAVGAIVDAGDYDYYEEIDSRTKRREDFNSGVLFKDGITTGYSGMDAHMFHAGWGRRELSCIMGPAKSGKSLSLGDFSKNAAMAGYNAFYGSCEVAAWIIAERLDAAISDTMINKLHMDPDEVRRRVIASQATSGHLKMRDFASGTLKPSQLQRVLEQYRAEGIIFDLVAVDYADIMAAEYRSDSLQENLRTIYIDLRALAFETGAAFLTATQTNRDGAKALTSKATDVGDDWNKARTVDLLIGINATDAEKTAGEARLYWALSRNSEDGFTLRIQQDRSKMQFLKKILGRE